jgi:SAM-dependent methyltransferase
MATLYEGKMAAIFDAMYQTFVDYDKEYAFYNAFLKENNCNNVLEMGSGTGNLGNRFTANHFDYKGLEYSESMIAIARERNPNCTYILGDMRTIALDTVVDAVIITGRSTSYLITNEDINNTLSCAYKNLSKEGIICFDFIDANRYIPYIIENQLIVHNAAYQGVQYSREGNWRVAPMENFMLHWKANYYTVQENSKTLISTDYSTVRVFTRNEMELFLYLNNFEIIKTIDRKSYAYDTYVIVAKKKS